MAFCTKCGAKNPDDAKFCGSCGEKLEKSSAENEKSSDSVELYKPTVENEKNSYGEKVEKLFAENEKNFDGVNTYWQGLGYAEKTPKIKYLLVAQGWGNFNLSDDFIKQIKNFNSGDISPLFSEKPKSNGTDKNLFELFKILGYDLSKRYDDLFFTNFCLGYRAPDAKTTGGMKQKIMMNDGAEFKRLCEILEPENILCLGQITSECVYETLKGFTLKDAYGDAQTYNEMLDRQMTLVAAYGENDSVLSNVYALAHCGVMGTMNRPLEKQIEDWTQILEEKKIDLAIENFCRTNTEENKNRVLEEIFARARADSTLIIAQENFDDGNFLNNFIPIFKNVTSVFLRNKYDGTYFLAAFTNLFEFAKFNESSGRNFNFKYVPAKKLLRDCLKSDDSSEGIILNPASENSFNLTRETLKDFWNKIGMA